MTSIASRLRSRWSRAHRYARFPPKLSTRNLHRLCREYATTARCLVVHSEDVPYEPYFPNAFTVTKRADVPADLHVDAHYRELHVIPSESYDVLLCTGLLEHVPDPQRLIDEFHRILRPGGRAIVSASAAFSLHECPDDYFRFTPFGFRVLFRAWSRFEVLRGSCGPFETIGILLQRILMQCDITPPVRPAVALLARTLRPLDRFVGAQFCTVQRSDASARIDSVLPSNLQAVVVK
jgi:SAM-dependent methyltransferase